MDNHPEFSFDVQPLLVNPRNAQSHAGVSISPAAMAGDDATRLMAVIAIDSREKSTVSIIQTLLDWWASQSTLLRGERAGEALEQACRAFNEAVLPLTGKDAHWLAKLHMLVAVYSSDMLHICQHGNTTAWLVRKGKIRNITAAEKETPALPPTVFSSLVSGRVIPDDVILLTTQSLFDFLSLEKINHALTHLDIARGVALINNLYPSDATADALACILMQLSTASTPAPRHDARTPLTRSIITKTPHLAAASAATQTSMSMLQSLERRTEELLDPTHWMDRKQVMQKLRRVFRLPPAPPQPARITPSARSSSWRRYARSAAQALFVYPFMIIRRFCIFLVTAFRNPTMLESIPQKASANLSELPRRTTVASLSWWQRFKQLPRKQQALLSIFALIILGFLTSIAALSQHTFVTQRRVDTEMLQGTIRGKVAAAEAALIYQDEVKARRLMDEAVSLLSKFPSEKEADQTARDALERSIVPLKEKVYHITNIMTPEVFIDFNLSEAPSPAHPYYLMIAGSALHTVDLDTNKILSISLSSAALDRTSPSPQAPGRIRDIKILDPERFIALQGSSFLAFSLPDNTWSTLPVPNAATYQIESFTTYAGRRIYAVDSKTGQIIRFTARAGQFQAGVPWLKNPLDTTTDSHITVDGSLYVSVASGAVRKFSHGELVADFSLDALQPPLALSDMFTSADHASFFVLDRTNKRLVRFNKESGALIRQYTSSSFDDLKGMAITTNEKTAYLLNGSRIFKISL